MTEKFLADFMLGRLTRTLRLLGIDTAYINVQDDNLSNPLAILKEAQAGGRILLTRNTKLIGYPSVVFIKSEKIEEQITQIIKSCRLEKDIKPFSRCLICNEVLVSVVKPSVKGRVPFFVFQTKNEFSICPKCQKIYWSGTHEKNMRKIVEKLTKQLKKD